jgi:hypothetical protein
MDWDDREGFRLDLVVFMVVCVSWGSGNKDFEWTVTAQGKAQGWLDLQQRI